MHSCPLELILQRKEGGVAEGLQARLGPAVLSAFCRSQKAETEPAWHSAGSCGGASAAALHVSSHLAAEGDRTGQDYFSWRGSTRTF